MRLCPESDLVMLLALPKEWSHLKLQQESGLCQVWMSCVLAVAVVGLAGGAITAMSLELCVHMTLEPTRRYLLDFQIEGTNS